MRFDQYGCLVREASRPPGHEIANLGDACADTCRLFIVSRKWMNDYHEPISVFAALGRKGWLRHPELYEIPGKEDWGTRGFSNDQLVPLMMAQLLYWNLREDWTKYLSGPFIKGTWKLAQPAVYAILYRQWWLLNIMNHIQGWLLGLPFRWSDDKSEGIGFRSSKGKVQDYPTMICTTVFLNKIGYKARLPRPAKECIEALEAYRFNPKDFEPNAEWEIEHYRRAISELEARPPDNLTDINTKDLRQLHGV